MGCASAGTAVAKGGALLLHQGIRKSTAGAGTVWDRLLVKSTPAHLLRHGVSLGIVAIALPVASLFSAALNSL